MRKQIVVVLLAVVAIGVAAGAVYYFRLTAPVAVSSEPPVAPTLDVASTPVAGATSGPLRVYRIDPAQSEALYRVEETFFDRNNLLVVAVGRTNAVAGDIMIDHDNLAASRIGSIVVDISQLKSDERNRDNAIRREWLESSTYPLATFQNASISDLPASWEQGEPFAFKMKGDLTVRDTTARVTWDVTTTLDLDTVTGEAVTQVRMSDFGFPPPRLLSLAVEDEVQLELNFVATATDGSGRSGDTAAESCAPTLRGPTSTEPIDEAPVRSSVGKGHMLSGVIKSSKDCAPIAGAKLIFWLTNPQGEYDDDHRATVFTDKSGAYSFESNFPGVYEDRPPHIHIYVSADGHRPVELERQPTEGQTEGTLDVVLAPEDQ